MSALMIGEHYPIGCRVSTIVYSAGARSEVVTGTVIEHKRRRLIVKTEWHGNLSVEPSKVQA